MADIDLIICSYNEAAYVTGVLDSLFQQTVQPQSFRIIFVDNASSDDTQRIVDNYRSKLNIEYVYEPRRGLNYARNAGLQRVQTEYVAFTDADARTEPRWISTMLGVIEKESPDLFGGPYFPYYIAPKPPWFKDVYNQAFLSNEARPLRQNEYLSGINMVWKREVIECLGGYNNKMGLTGRGLKRGGESNLMFLARLKIPNLKALYCPEMIVYHLTRSETMSTWYWIRRNFVQGFRQSKVFPERSKTSGFMESFKGFYWSFRSLLNGLKGCLTRDRNAYPFWQNYFFENMIGLIYDNGVSLNSFLQVLKNGFHQKSSEFDYPSTNGK